VHRVVTSHDIKTVIPIRITVQPFTISRSSPSTRSARSASRWPWSCRRPQLAEEGSQAIVGKYDELPGVFDEVEATLSRAARHRDLSRAAHAHSGSHGAIGSGGSWSPVRSCFRSASCAARESGSARGEAPHAPAGLGDLGPQFWRRMEMRDKRGLSRRSPVSVAPVGARAGSTTHCSAPRHPTPSEARGQRESPFEPGLPLGDHVRAPIGPVA
jgi:hypothetical protein